MMTTARFSSVHAAVFAALTVCELSGPSVSFGLQTPGAAAPSKVAAPQAELKTPSTTPAPPEGAASLSAPPAVEPRPAIVPDRYFVIVFGSESVPKRGKYTHTWFTIVKATPNLDAENTYKLDILHLLNPKLEASDLKRYCECCTHTFNGQVYWNEKNERTITKVLSWLKPDGASVPARDKYYKASSLFQQLRLEA